MLARFFARRALEKFGSRYNYDVGYMRDMLDIAPRAFFKFSPLSRLAAHREVVPAEAATAAKILGTLAEDCGPCVQLNIDIAREAGVDDSQITAIVQHDVPAMNEATALAYHFASAILKQSPDVMARREAVRSAWGDKGVIELTLALQISRVFPMLKTGLGYAESCQRLQLGQRQLDIARPTT